MYVYIYIYIYTVYVCVYVYVCICVCVCVCVCVVCVCVCAYIYACIQLNAALMCVRDFLLKHLNVANPKVLNGSVYLYLHIKEYSVSVFLFNI